MYLLADCSVLSRWCIYQQTAVYWVRDIFTNRLRCTEYVIYLPTNCSVLSTWYVYQQTAVYWVRDIFTNRQQCTEYMMYLPANCSVLSTWCIYQQTAVYWVHVVSTNRLHCTENLMYLPTDCSLLTSTQDAPNTWCITYGLQFTDIYVSESSVIAKTAPGCIFQPVPLVTELARTPMLILSRATVPREKR